MKKRDSFIFYRSFVNALDSLEDEQYARVFRAISKFALDGKETKLSGVEKVIFELVKPQLVSNQKRWENGCKGGRKPNEVEPGTGEKIESYNQIISDMAFSVAVEKKVREFIKHCLANGHVLINSELEGILVELDLKYGDDDERITALNEAIKYGYFGLKGGAT